MSEPWKWGDEGKPKPEYKEPTGRHLCCGMDAEMRPFADGDWVPYDDLARVQAELADCKSTADQFKAEVERLEFIHRMDTLAIKKQKEEIERLNYKLGRLLGAEREWVLIEPEEYQRLKAKEGKQS